MADVDVRGILTNKIGPFPGWAWGAIIAVSAYAILQFRARTKPSVVETGGLVRDPVTGEFRSAQSQETVDPATGERRTSSFEASGNLSPFGGGVGLPIAYPMPFSSGDVFVNLPGDSQNLRPSQPVTSGVYYPPKTAPGPGVGQAGGYWWTPLNEADAADFPLRSIPGANPGNREPFRTRIMIANPQIDWTKGDFRARIGIPIYIPPVTIRGVGGPHTDPPWPLPPQASLQGPANYSPPSQTTSVSGTV